MQSGRKTGTSERRCQSSLPDWLGIFPSSLEGEEVMGLSEGIQGPGEPQGRGPAW